MATPAWYTLYPQLEALTPFDKVPHSIYVGSHVAAVRHLIDDHAHRQSLDGDGGQIGVLGVQTVPITVVNTTTETAVGLLTILADTLGTNIAVPFEWWGLIATTGSPSMTLRVKLGTTTMLSPAFGPYAVGATPKLIRVIGYIKANAATNAQLAQASYKLDDNAALPFDGVASEDSETDLDVAVTAQWSVASASNTITRHYFKLGAAEEPA